MTARVYEKKSITPNVLIKALLFIWFDFSVSMDK